MKRKKINKQKALENENNKNKKNIHTFIALKV